MQHAPVMLDEVITAITPKDGEVYVDGTFGRGGYSAAMLDHANCTVYGIDRDPQAIQHGKELSKKYNGRLRMIAGQFGDMHTLLQSFGVKQVNGIALDVGVSSPQLDDPTRGFSFRYDGPLDMRMDPTSGLSAADVINTTPEKELADLIYKYGEEKKSRSIARAIVAAREENQITTTKQLADIVRSVVKPSKDGMDPATRTFQALRIYVNDELGELERGLHAAEQLLADDGRLVVVSFHSLEDRIVKNFLREKTGNEPGPSRHVPVSANTAPPSFRHLDRKAQRPAATEISANPRAKSARLRAAVRTFAKEQSSCAVLN